MVNYDTARAVAKRVLSAKAQETQGYTAQLHKAQQAAESALDMYAADSRRQLSLLAGLTTHVVQVPEELCVKTSLFLATLRKGRQCLLFHMESPSISEKAQISAEGKFVVLYRHGEHDGGPSRGVMHG